MLKNASSEGGKRTGGAKSMGIPTPMKALRIKCLDCCCGSAQYVSLYTITPCALWPYRMGRRPKAAKGSA